MAEKFNKTQGLLVIIVILSVAVHFLLVMHGTRNYLKNWWQQHIVKTENDKPKLGGTITEKAYINKLEVISLSPEEKSAVKIICQEFKNILQKGKMRTDINIIEYWQKVFDNANHPELFQKGLPYIRMALKPGRDKYKKEGRILVEEFVQLALNALEKIQ